MEGGGDLPEAPAIPPSVAAGPIVKGRADGALKGLERHQPFDSEEGGPDVGIGREGGVIAVLFQQLVVAAVDDILEVGADWQRQDGEPAGSDLPASGKAAVRQHEQVECRHLVRHRHCEGTQPQYRR
jgi:hypothetical protein